MLIKKNRLVALLALIALLVAACAAPAAPAAPADSAAPAAPAAGPVTFTVAASADIDTADPHVSQLLMFNNIIRLNVFNSLVRYAPNLDLEPDLAESWSNPDDRTYIFNLRQGVQYHNGQEVEAKDVEFSFRRILDNQTVFSSRVANIESYEVLDKYTIQITLAEPQADFLDGLVFLSIAPESAAAAMDKQPVGSGPFQFVEWIPNDRIVLERNPEYWETDLVQVDRLVFRIIPEPQVAIANLQSGDVDGVLDVPVSQATFFNDSTDVKAIIQPTSSFHLYEMLGQNSEPIRTDVRVRQALAHCLDKDTIQQTVFSGEGRQKWSFVPYGSWAYQDEAGYAYDPERARELLSEAGLESGFSFSVIIPSGYPDGERLTTIWQACLAEIGVQLNIEVQELSVWLDNYINHTYDVSWNVFPGFADPNYFVSLGLQPHFADGWDNPAAAAAATTANRTIDQAERVGHYAELQAAAVAELPVIVVQETPQASLVKPTVEGWEINPLGMVIVRGVSITQ